MKVVKRPPVFTAIQFFPGADNAGVSMGSFEIIPTWAGAGSEPPGIMPYDEESTRRRRGHQDVWRLHAQGVRFWVGEINDIAGVEPGDWIIFRDGSSYVEQVLSDESFRRVYVEVQ